MRPLVPWVPETFLARFPALVSSQNLLSARKTSGTQGSPLGSQSQKNQAIQKKV